MKRRRFLMGTLAASSASAITAPAIAQVTPEVRWRLASSFPKNTILYFGAEYLTRRVAELTDNKFKIQAFGPGELIPALQVLDAVQNGTIECGSSASYYYLGKDFTFGFDCAVPFGLNARHQNAWLYHGGGLQLLRAFFKEYNIYNIPSGNTGAQMGGWFRKEIKTVDDLKGLKFRCSGFAGQVLSRIGVVPQMLGAGDVYPALERGAIDAAEWVGPYDDEKMGFYKVAKFYYYPGWWEGSAQVSTYVHLPQWEALPAQFKAALESACAEASVWMQSRFDAENPPALRRLIANGAQLRGFSTEIMKACYEAAFRLYDEVASSNSHFKTILEPWLRFREEEYLWFRVAENSFDNFVYAQSQRKT
jgi:TRAP-type mannitol/chloroaromatic compound transport system substrate-binding protein